MKGTIDVQIKHKDGSIETRHEHNVVFDIPALTFKKWSESPLAMATGVPTTSVMLTGDRFTTFCLSEDPISVTEPQYVPEALITGSGGANRWYYGPATATTTDKTKTLAATWTVQSAMTLKSIFYQVANASSLLNSSAQPRLIGKDDIRTGMSTRLRKSVLDLSYFALNKASTWNGLVSDGTPTASVYETVYVGYPLCNSDERFIFSYKSGSSTYYSSYPFSGAGSVLEIRNKDTNEVIRSFPMTQFTGLRQSFTPPSGSTGKDYSYQYVCVVNTGTKNVLIQPAYGGTSLNIWQIPDTATEDPIPIVATVLENQCNYFAENTNVTVSVNQAMSVIGPYMYWLPNQTATGSSRRANVCRINDDFSVTTFSGLCGSAIYSADSSNWQYSSGKMTLVREYQDYSHWTYGNSNNGRYTPIYFNITAANFSTPIVLAEGDVLTVSYKIEVA